KLLGQDWPVNNGPLQARAAQKVEALAKLLDRGDQKDKARRLLESAGARQRRDLVVKLAWQGEAGLDLHVAEPPGSVCSPLSRQTVGGGTLIGDTLSNPTGETYVAAQAFPGEYTVTVERVWGRPLGGKAQLKIILSQGTEDEAEQLVTV